MGKGLWILFLLFSLCACRAQLPEKEVQPAPSQAVSGGRESAGERAGTLPIEEAADREGAGPDISEKLEESAQASGAQADRPAAQDQVKQPEPSGTSADQPPGAVPAKEPEAVAPVPQAPAVDAPSETIEGEPSAPGEEESALQITVGDRTLAATWEENSSAQAFRELLAQGSLSIEMEDYGGFEKVGSLGTTLPRNDTQITTQPGDVIPYQGNQITIYYGTNSWSFTRLARIDDSSGLQEMLGEGTVSITFSLA